jgi:hypothetical protein
MTTIIIDDKLEKPTPFSYLDVPTTYSGILKEYGNISSNMVNTCSTQAKRAHLKTDEQPSKHAFINAIHTAYATHNSLEISPDVMWLTILQSFSSWINHSDNAEKYRKKFVAHDGKVNITIEDNELRLNEPNDWTLVFDGFSDGIRKHIGASAHGAMTEKFSTSTPISVAATNVALMDVCKSYFVYTVMTRCGIPSIRITGSRLDWMAMRNRIQYFRQFGLELWVEQLTSILNRFVDAFDNHIV